MSPYLEGNTIMPDWSPAAYEKLAAWLTGETGMLTVYVERDDDPTAAGDRVLRTRKPDCTVDIHRMIASWRVSVITGRMRLAPSRYWCYAGTGQKALLRAVLAVAAWDGSPDTEPEGWTRNGQTEERRLGREAP